jgi:hypothetical protein
MKEQSRISLWNNTKSKFRAKGKLIQEKVTKGNFIHLEERAANLTSSRLGQLEKILLWDHQRWAHKAVALDSRMKAGRLTRVKSSSPLT